jgi:hypothetical protein
MTGGPSTKEDNRPGNLKCPSGSSLAHRRYALKALGHPSRSSLHASTASPLAIRAMLSIDTLRSDRSTPLR